MTIRTRGITIGTGVGLGTMLAAPAAAQADDFRVINKSDDGPGSLRRALENARDNAGADRVLFRSKLSGEIGLDGGFFVNHPVDIIGPGARRLAVRAQDGSRILYLSDSASEGTVVTVSGLTLTGTNDFSGSGGAILSKGSDLTLSEAAISGNAGGGGGAIRLDGGSLTVESSTISNNESDSNGGGILSGSANVAIRNATISGNSAGGYGGGVYAYGGTLTVENSTVASNVGSTGGGGIAARDADVELRGSIVANRPDDLYGVLDTAEWTVAFSLIGDPSGATIDDAGGNLLGVDPRLKPLKNNGGPTDTHAFKKSKAKNAIPKSQTPKRDQRGAKRKGKGDIGAYELVKCRGVIVNRVGTGKKDKLKGTKRKDGILGLGGNDVLKGKKGKDGLCGGRGKDKLKGGDGKDKLDGGPGKDKEVQ